MISRLPGFLYSMFLNRWGRSSLPRFLTYTVTFGCNARCIMCDSWKKPAQGDLTVDEFDAIARQLPRMDGVRLTGGEPFARKDLVDLAQIAGDRLRPLMLHVTTNGFLTERIVDFCERRPRRIPLDLLVSIDGVGEKHNEIRGNSRAYEMCLETIEALASRRRELALNLTVNQTIVDAEGLDHYRRLREVLKKYDVRNNVVMAYDASATYSLESEVDVAPREIGQFCTFGEFSPDLIAELLDEIDADIERLPWSQRLAKRYYSRGIRNRLLHEEGEPNPLCVALNSHLRIFPNGDVPTCQFNSRIIGNLRKQSFSEIWSGLLAQQQRDWVARCPGCWAECEVLPSAIYTGDLLRVAFSKSRVPAVSVPLPIQIDTNPTGQRTIRKTA